MYMVLEDPAISRTDELIQSPAHLILLVTLEIAVEDSTGAYMLLGYHSYDLGRMSGTEPDEGFWAPPFIGKTLPSPDTTPESVGELLDCIDNLQKQVNLTELREQLAYSLALPADRKFGEVQQFTELKRSPRDPRLVNAYRIIRFPLRGVGNRGRINLADPEMRKGHVFLPLNRLDDEDVITRRTSQTYGTDLWQYLGKPLPTNTSHILTQRSNVESLKRSAIRLRPSEFVRSETGLVIVADIANYGTASRYALEQMRTFDTEGRTIAERFRRSVATLFYEFVTSLGITQVHMAGDGLIAAIPRRHYLETGIAATVTRVLTKYRRVIEQVEKFNSHLPNASTLMGTRLALHFGEYRFGRIAEAASFSADFEGGAIIEAARAEAALREYTKGSLLESPGLDRISNAEDRHTLIVTPDLLTQLSENPLPLGEIGRLRMRIKESLVDAPVYRIS
ncbi:MAG TPA: hypothetical protein VFQ45_00865 [Longimicrobium sp.]|nr:hypothetical protein [Longimicrobium sp.]